jgi:putative lipoprotein
MRRGVETLMRAVALSRIVMAALALGAAQVGLAQPAADAITVSGSAAYRQRIAMPAQAVLTVRIEDVSRADAAARVVAEVREAFGARQVPIPFTLSVPRSAIDPRAIYGLRATITVDDELRFTTTRHYAVLVAGAPSNFELVLEPPAAAPAVPASPLEDTDWTLVELDGKAIAAALPPQREVRMRLSGDGSRVAGFSGCNQFMGGYARAGAALRFTQLAGTMMACATLQMDLEVQVLQMLGSTSGYRIEGQWLTLLAAERVLARFEASRPR